ncbi:hypothetical protein HUS23_07565 [Ectothiorhodospiraceae bacterium 2226]|nr:hypothetical protein HUS23_07565 [Ectothiorhodospiraceae bacterium 2226]
MQIYVGNIRGTKTDLHGFFGTYARRAETFRILQRTGRRPGVRYAVIELEPDRLAEKAIAGLNGKRLLGTPVTVREFVYRYCANERRALNWRQRPWPHAERRQTERRFNPVNIPPEPEEKAVEGEFLWDKEAYLR